MLLKDKVGIEFIFLRTFNKMKLLIFTEGTIMMHKDAINHTREEIIRQVKTKQKSVRDYEHYVPIFNSVEKLQNWKDDGVDIIYLTSRIKSKEINQIRTVIKIYNFPKGELIFRRENENYREVIVRIIPDILIEDDCESIGGIDEMSITYVDPKIKEKIKSISILEFGGIDHLPNNIIQL